MKRILVGLFVVVLIAVFGGRMWYLHQQAEQNKDAIKIGVVVPLSGFDENLTNRVVTTLKIATEELTADKPYKIQYLFEDGRYTVKDSISAFNKLKTSNPDAYIVFGDLPAFGLLPLINETKVPTIALALGDSQLPSKSPYMFRVCTSTTDLVKKIADFVFHDMKQTEMAIFKVKNNYGDDFSNEFQKYYTALGGKILIEESYNIGDMDVRAQALKILDEKPQLIGMFGFGPGYNAAFNQLAERGYKGDFITDHTVTDEAVWKNIYNQAEGTYFAIGDYRVDQMSPRYLERYRAKIGSDPDVFAVLSYVTVDVLMKALENKTDLNQGFYDIQNFKTVMGIIGYDKDGEPHPPVIIKQMQSNGAAKVIKE
ncbi:MAG: ABC transporter substrate-binding protein [Alphaproteobacteria bacterium]|nr:ABC transporter substrate-binding protein [Alphaproteobacteria bacterium]